MAVADVAHLDFEEARSTWDWWYEGSVPFPGEEYRQFRAEAEVGDEAGGAVGGTEDGTGNFAGGSEGGVVDGPSRPSPGAAEEPAGESDESTILRNAGGPGALATYESGVRAGYLKQIGEASAEAVEQIDDIIKRVEAGNLPSEHGVAQAEEVARQVSGKRDATRTAAQKKLGPGGRLLSEAIEQPKSFDTRVGEKGGRNLNGLRGVATSAGKSNPAVTGLTKFGRVAGPLGLAIGVGLGATAVANAPADERADVAVEETAAFAAGAVGSTLATAGAVAGVGLLVSLSVIAAPAALTLIGIGLVAGAIGGYLASEGARSQVRKAQGRK